MKNVWAIASRELRSYFLSPLAYLVAAFFVFGSGLLFWLILQSGREASLTGLIQNVHVLFLFVIPMVSMRLLAEEQRTGTMELLMTNPVQEWEIVVGKFIGSACFVAFMLLATLLFPIFLFIFGSPDLGPIITGYIGALLQGSAFLAIGLWASSLTESQIVAAVISFIVLLGLWLSDNIGQATGGVFGQIMSYTSLINHIQGFSQGVLDTKDLIFYLTVIAAGLVLSTLTLQSREVSLSDGVEVPEKRGGFSIDSLRVPLVGFGLFALFAGLIVWLIGGLPDLVPRLLVAAGILLLGVYVALDPEDVWNRLTGRSVLASGNTLVIAVAALVILGLFNVLGSRYETKYDATANKKYSLSDDSVRLVQALPENVHVTGWLTSNDGRKQDFQQLLDNYASKSGGKLTYEFIDPEQRAADARAAGITATGTIVYMMGDKKQESTGTTENDVSTALVKLERPQKVIYFTTGHGERSTDGSGPADYGSLKTALQKDNFTVNTLNLLTSRTVPDDASEIVIGGPTNPLLQEEKDALKAYLDGGGKVIFLIGPGSQTDVNDLLQPYQASISGNVVVDPVMSAPQDPRIIAVTSYATHPITKDLGQTLTFFPLTTTISTPAAAQSGGTTTNLAQSSDQSWASSNLQNPARQDSDPHGPLTVAATIDPGAAATGAGATAPTGQPRMVIFGSPDLISNNSLSQVPGNQQLFLNAADWVAAQDNLINITAPDTTPRPITLIGWQSSLIAVSSVLLLPLAILAAGAAVWWTRR